MAERARAAVAAFFLIGLALGASGCNTISGLGQDVEAAGEGISNTAEDVQEDM